MLYRHTLLLSTLIFAGVQAAGQSVISAHSGLVHFSDGVVFLDDEPLAWRNGRFPDIREGCVLRTEDGRAEVLLTPGVFLRMGEHSAIRMVSKDLPDTRVEFLEGSAIVHSTDVPRDNSVILIYKEWRIRLPQHGSYRIDSEPPQVRINSGEIEVSLSGKTMVVNEGRLICLSPAMLAVKSSDRTADELDRWVQKRSKSTGARTGGGAGPPGDWRKSRAAGPFQSAPTTLPRGIR